jgi:hypothetical protein
MKNLRVVLLSVALLSPAVAPVVARADVYLQYPRGSNNRLDSGSSSTGSSLLDLILSIFG